MLTAEESGKVREREREGEENEQHTSKNPRERKPLYKVERNAM